MTTLAILLAGDAGCSGRIDSVGESGSTVTTSAGHLRKTIHVAPAGNVCASGESCTTEGASRGGDCPDECNFCDYQICENGCWTDVEAFPATDCGEDGGPGDDGGDGGPDGGVCPSDPSSVVGQACSNEGTVCGDCSDPCQFCNEVICSGGEWSQIEAFPIDCVDAGTPPPQN